jgi:hypothetical protein
MSNTSGQTYKDFKEDQNILTAEVTRLVKAFEDKYFGSYVDGFEITRYDGALCRNLVGVKAIVQTK